MAALLDPKRKVVAVCGDGGFMMNSQELETAVRLKLNLVVVVLVDDGYGMIRWKQDALGFASWGLGFGNPDFVKYAEAYGAHGHCIKATDQLAQTLRSALDQGGVHLVEVPIDYSENQRVLVDELAAHKREKDGEQAMTLAVHQAYDRALTARCPQTTNGRSSRSSRARTPLSDRSKWLTAAPRIAVLEKLATLVDISHARARGPHRSRGRQAADRRAGRGDARRRWRAQCDRRAAQLRRTRGAHGPHAGE